MSLPMKIQQGQLAGPYDPVWRDFNTMLNRFFGEHPFEESGILAPYGVDIHEDADHIYVEAELPGFNKDDVDIALENQTLTITAEKKQEPPQKPQRPDYLLHERRYRRFVRSFTLPNIVDQQKVDAKLQDGILMITLNKHEQTKPKKIPIS